MAVKGRERWLRDGATDTQVALGRREEGIRRVVIGKG